MKMIFTPSIYFLAFICIPNTNNCSMKYFKLFLTYYLGFVQGPMKPKRSTAKDNLRQEREGLRLL